MQQNSKSKIIAGAVIIAAVALIAVAASMFTKDDAKQSSENSQDSATLQQPADTSSADQSTASSTTTNSSATYKDGTYTESENYRTEGGQEGLTVTLTVSNNTVSSVNIQQSPSNHESEEYQSIFETSYKSKIVGKALSDLQLSRISGASDTTNSFNDALDAIRAKAQA